MELEQVHTCPLCGRQSFRRYRRIDEWQIAQCSHCQLAFLNPRPTATEVEKVLEVYCGYPPMPTDSAEKQRLIALEEYRLAPLLQFRKTGTLLDVGFGSGFFMALAQGQGWTVMGTEITPRCVKYAREELGLTVYPGDLSELNTPHSFDVISIHHVLEHVSDPLALVQAAKALLHKNGLLYISVPNHQCFDARVQGLKWEGWSLPWHFYHYTPTTLRRLLERCGLRILDVDYARSEELNKPWIIRLRRHLPDKWLQHIFYGTNLMMIASENKR